MCMNDIVLILLNLLTHIDKDSAIFTLFQNLIFKFQTSLAFRTFWLGQSDNAGTLMLFQGDPGREIKTRDKFFAFTSFEKVYTVPAPLKATLD